jgi:hypothetical protein
MLPATTSFLLGRPPAQTTNTPSCTYREVRVVLTASSAIANMGRGLFSFQYDGIRLLLNPACSTSTTDFTWSRVSTQEDEFAELHHSVTRVHKIKNRISFFLLTI